MPECRRGPEKFAANCQPLGVLTASGNRNSLVNYYDSNILNVTVNPVHNDQGYNDIFYITIKILPPAYFVWDIVTTWLLR
jgi:hypothetical protein